MKNIIAIVIMVTSGIMLMLAICGDGPYETKLHIAVIGLVGMISSVLLAIAEDYWR